MSGTYQMLHLLGKLLQVEKVSLSNTVVKSASCNNVEPLNQAASSAAEALLDSSSLQTLRVTATMGYTVGTATDDVGPVWQTQLAPLQGTLYYTVRALPVSCLPCQTRNIAAPSFTTGYFLKARRPSHRHSPIRDRASAQIGPLQHHLLHLPQQLLMLQGLYVRLEP